MLPAAFLPGPMKLRQSPESVPYRCSREKAMLLNLCWRSVCGISFQKQGSMIITGIIPAIQPVKMVQAPGHAGVNPGYIPKSHLRASQDNGKSIMSGRVVKGG